MLKKEDLKIYWEKAVKFLSHISKLAIVVAAMFVGFTMGEIYQHYKTKTAATEMQETRGHDVTSVAINDRKEIMIIDRKTGTYQVFSDSVGLMIFNLYANQMYSTSTKSEK